MNRREGGRRWLVLPLFLSLAGVHRSSGFLPSPSLRRRAGRGDVEDAWKPRRQPPAPVRMVATQVPDVLPPPLPSDDDARRTRGRRAVAGKRKGLKARVMGTFKEAQQHLRSGRTTVGIGLLEQCVELDPTDGHSWLALCRAEARRGNVPEARDLFSKGTALCPRNVHLWQAWAMLEHKAGNYCSARMYFERGLEVEACNPYICHAWGRMETKAGNLPRARELFLTALEAGPQPQVSVALAELEAQTGDYDAARLRFRQCREALAAVESVHAADAEDRATLDLASAKMEEELGRKEMAHDILCLARLENPHNLKVAIALAQLLSRMDRVEESRALFEQTSELPIKDTRLGGALYNSWAMLELKAAARWVNQTRSATRPAPVPEAALQLIRTGIKRFPAEQCLYQTLGTMLHRRGDLDGARAAFEQSISIQPTGPAFTAWALMEEEHGRAPARQSKALTRPANTAAQQAIEEVVQCGPRRGFGVQVATGSFGCHETHKLFACLRRCDVPGQGMAKARVLFEQGIQHDPAHGPLYNAFGAMEERHGNIDAARKVLERGLAANCSGMAHVWHGLGRLELRLGNVTAARDIFKGGILRCAGLKGVLGMGHCEDVSFLYHSLGTLELQSQRHPAACQVFSEGIRRYPNNSHLLLGAALVESKLNEIDSARDFFRRAASADRTHAHAWQAWGVMETRLRNYRTARSLFESGLKYCPDHGALWQAYGMLEVSQDNYKLARALFKAGAERCEANVQLLQAWACLEERMGNVKDARALIERAVRMDPRHGPCWTAYGVIEERQGNLDRARSIFQMGISNVPYHGPLYRSFAELEARMGNFARAREIFDQGIEVDPFEAQLFHSYAEMEARLCNIAALKRLDALARKLYSPDSTEREGQRLLAAKHRCQQRAVPVDDGDKTFELGLDKNVFRGGSHELRHFF